ncbi:MAG: cell surface protein SprA, partial [Calditrichia bacterium]|nr:cell surface protein SprA [Calditrichia bacterium]
MSNRIINIVIIGIFLIPFFLGAQTDTLSTQSLSIDSLISDSLLVDSSLVDTMVYSFPDSVRVRFAKYPFQRLVDEHWVPYSEPRFNLRPKASNVFKCEAHLDSSQNNIIFSYKFGDTDYLLPMGMPVEDYLKEVQRIKFREGLYVKNRKFLAKGIQSTGQGIELNVPFRIKSKAFRRVFGGDQVGFKVTGNITLEMAGEVDNYPGAKSSAYQKSTVFSPKFKETQQFQVEGRVGEKVTVNVQQNSEATFDFENTLKIKYDGDDDEIVQSIEAGNVSLSLPSTRFVSGGSKHQGLFGLKAKMQIGKLKFTSIASLEKGEKKKKTLTGGAQEQSYGIYDHQFVKNQFFFVDSFYIDKFDNFNENMDWLVLQSWLDTKQIMNLEVWVSETTSNENIKGVAAINPGDYSDYNDTTTVEEIPGIVEEKHFRQLKYLEDFDYDAIRGFFWLTTPVERSRVIGIAYRLKDGTSRSTTLVSELTDSTSVLKLKLIKPSTLNSTYEHCWSLMMKNVYDVGSRIPAEGFDLKVRLYRDGGNEEVQQVAPAKHFTYLLGLDRLNDQGVPVDDGDGNADINNGNIFLRKYGKIVFPSLEPFNPSSDAGFQGIDSSYYVDIYNLNLEDEQARSRESKFEILYTSSEVKSSFSLGFNILEGSEEVRLNGRKLERGIDYTIDYFSGDINILEPDAQKPDANIEIDYESANIFQLNKKTLFGMHGIYEFNEDNFIGAAGMFLNKTSIDDKIRLGQEPTKDFIWDVHGQFSKKSRWLTRMIDKLPIIQTDKESKFQINAEIAQIRPNPNTRNNKATGDNEGVAYIDDFEGSERSTSLGLAPGIWNMASNPVWFHNSMVSDSIDQFNFTEMMYYDTSRVHLNWYWQQTNVKNIWPEREVSRSSGTAGTTNILRFRWRNENNKPDDRNWWGVMRSTKAFPNQQRTKYIELWIWGYTGRLHINIGKISEDWWIQGETTDGSPSFQNLNTEDINYNGFLEEEEDTGIDGVKGNDASRIPGDAWDDDYKSYSETTPKYYNVNGTEGNYFSSEEKFPDSEDLDREGLDRFNDYFEYEISLDSNSVESRKYFVGKTPNGWRQIRIPIGEITAKIGNPDTNFQEIYFARLWMNELPEDDELHYLDIAAFDFVGYEWEELGIAENDTSEFVKNDTLFQVTVYNTEENAVQLSDPGSPQAYYEPPGVKGKYDRINEIHSKEQSLVFRAGRLEPGQIAAAEKFLLGGQRYDLSQYKNMKLFVHGDWNLTEDDTTLLFKMQFGHSETDYYEVIYPVEKGWVELETNLDDLTGVKQDQFLVDTTENGKPVHKFNIPGYSNRYYVAVGEPSVNNITYLRYSLKNASPLVVGKTYENIEVWVDELRASDVRKEPGMAMRIEANIELADIARYSGQIESKDANFHGLGQTSSAAASTTENVSHNINLYPQKLLPSKFNISIPISIRYKISKQIPKYHVKSDRLTGYGYSSMLDRFSALFGGKEILDDDLNRAVKFSESMGYSFSFKRTNGPKDPWYLKYTLNQMSTGYNFSNSVRSDYNTLKGETENRDINFKYNIPFGRNNFIKPLKWTKNIPVLKNFAEQKLYYTPSQLSTNFSVKNNYTYKESRVVGAEIIEKSNIITSRSITSQYTLTDQIKMSYSRNYAGDASQKGYNFNDYLNSIISEGYFGTTTRTGQNFSLNYNPKRWFTFFTPSVTYSSQFNYTFQINNHAITASQGRNYRIGGTLKLDKLMERIYKPKDKKKRKAQKSRKSTPKTVKKKSVGETEGKKSFGRETKKTQDLNEEAGNKNDNKSKMIDEESDERKPEKKGKPKDEEKKGNG